MEKHVYITKYYYVTFEFGRPLFDVRLSYINGEFFWFNISVLRFGISLNNDKALPF